MPHVPDLTAPDPAWPGDDEVRRRDAGVDGNARLTGATGVLLVLVLLVEGVTILRIRQLISVHIFVGMMLIPPVALKTGSTGYRIVRYYRGDVAYVRKGPPPWPLRLLGPVVIGLTFVVLGTGVGLLALRPDQRGLLLTAHQASFIGWLAVTSVHVLAHLRDTVQLAWQDWHPQSNRPDTRRARLRLAAVVVSLMAGVGVATAVMPLASPWTGSAFVHAHDRHE